MNLHFVITGKPVSWKRGRVISKNRRTGKRFLRRASHQERWFKSALAQLREQWIDKRPIPKSIELNAQIISYLADLRLIDASNLYQGPEDALQHKDVGILEDDCCIRSHDRSDRRMDRLNPRVEITLTEWRGDGDD